MSFQTVHPRSLLVQIPTATTRPQHVTPSNQLPLRNPHQTISHPPLLPQPLLPAQPPRISPIHRIKPKQRNLLPRTPQLPPLHIHTKPQPIIIQHHHILLPPIHPMNLERKQPLLPLPIPLRCPVLTHFTKPEL